MQKSENLSNDEETVCEKLLHLIEDGDADQILSAEYTASLNELIKNEFITLEDDKVLLTAKGREAKLLGIKALIDPVNPLQDQVKISDFSEVPVKPVMNPSLIIILVFFLVSMIAIFALMNQ